MAYTHKGLYSWYNYTMEKAYYWKDKHILEHQRNQCEICINIEVDYIIKHKQIIKGPSKALINRVNMKKDTLTNHLLNIKNYVTEKTDTNHC